MNITKQRLKQIIKEELMKEDDDYLSDEQYIRAGFTPPTPEERAMADDPHSSLVRKKPEVEGEDYIVYRGMKYMLPAEPEQRAAIESFIDAFFDKE